MVDIEYVVDFLYNGETNLPQEDLNIFLETAQEFQIKGLHKSEDNRGERTQKSFTHSPDQKLNQPQKIEEHFIPETSIIDSVDELADSYVNSDVAIAQTMEEENYDIGSNQELDLQIERMIEREERMWKCKECGKTSKSKTNIKQHAETHIEGVSHECNLCSKTFSTRMSLKVHKNNIHGGSLLTCNICGMTGMNTMVLYQHNKRHHMDIKI